MLNSNSYKKARTNRMVVEELTKETEIDLFVMDGHKKIVDENVKFLAPSLIHKAIEYIWKGTNKLSREVKLAIEYFKIDEIVNRDGSSLVIHPDGIFIDEYCVEEKNDTTANWDQLLDYKNSKILRLLFIMYKELLVLIILIALIGLMTISTNLSAENRKL